MKELYWIGNSRRVVRAFPPEVRRLIGRALDTAQRGDKDQSAKPLKGFAGVGVLEIVMAMTEICIERSIQSASPKPCTRCTPSKRKSKRGIATPKQEIDLVRRRLAAADYRSRSGAGGG